MRTYGPTFDIMKYQKQLLTSIPDNELSSPDDNIDSILKLLRTADSESSSAITNSNLSIAQLLKAMDSKSGSAITNNDVSVAASPDKWTYDRRKLVSRLGLKPNIMLRMPRISRMPMWKNYSDGPNVRTDVSWPGKSQGVNFEDYRRNPARGRMVEQAAAREEAGRATMPEAMKEPFTPPEVPNIPAVQPRNPLDELIEKTKSSILTGGWGLNLADRLDLQDQYIGGLQRLWEEMDRNKAQEQAWQASFAKDADVLRSGLEAMAKGLQDQPQPQLQPQMQMQQGTPWDSLLDQLLRQRMTSSSPQSRAALRDKYVSLNKGALTDAMREAEADIRRAYGGVTGYANPYGEAGALARMRADVARKVGELGMQYDLAADRDLAEREAGITRDLMAAIEAKRAHDQSLAQFNQNMAQALFQNRRAWLSDYQNVLNFLRQLGQIPSDERFNKMAALLNMTRGAIG